MEHINQTIKKMGTPSQILKKISQVENTDTWYNDNDCPICHGARIVLPIVDGKIDNSRTIPCKCSMEENKKRKREMLIKMCFFPPFAENMRFEKFEKYPEVVKAYNEAKIMANNPNKLKWLAFLGNNGNGKTHLAICICRAWVEAGVPAKYTLVSLLLEELRQGYKTEDKENSYDAKLQMYCDIPLLLLDDYGMESGTPWVQEKLDTIVDYRLMHNKSLIITSNLSLDEMPNRIRSRLIRHPNKVIVALTTEEYSMRSKK